MRVVWSGHLATEQHSMLNLLRTRLLASGLTYMPSRVVPTLDAHRLAKTTLAWLPPSGATLIDSDQMPSRKY